MLWYKTWCETRSRFFISALALAWVCLVIVITNKGNRSHSDPPMAYAAYMWQAVYKGYVRDFFIILVIVLGGGGLFQERSHGTSGFTLALPVSRSRLMFSRAAVGLVEVVLLAFVPAVMIAVSSPYMSEYYPLAQSLQYAALWSVCGALILAAAILLSTVLAGEYSGWIVCFVCLMLYSAAVHITGLQQFPSINLFNIMSGINMPYFDSGSRLLTGPLPYLPLSVILAIALAMVAAADRFTQRRDY